MACPAEALTPEQVEARLGELHGWQLKNNALERVYTGSTYLQALDALNQVARLSEAADHHPELTLGWKRLTIRYWTHTANGVTERDFELAGRVEALLSGLESARPGTC